MEHKNLHKKLGFTSVTFYLWWFFRSTLSLGAPNWLCEVTAGMAFGSIAAVAVNRLMTMMFGKRVGPFPTTPLSTSSKVIGQNLVFPQKWGMNFYFCFLQIRSDKDGFCPILFDKKNPFLLDIERDTKRSGTFMKRWEIPWGADEVGAPMRPTNLAQLDGYLRKLGMLAEAGDTNFFHDFL